MIKQHHIDTARHMVGQEVSELAVWLTMRLREHRGRMEQDRSMLPVQRYRADYEEAVHIIDEVFNNADRS